MARLRQRADKAVEVVFMAALVYILIRGLYAQFVERRLRLPIVLALVAFVAAGLIQGILSLRSRGRGRGALPRRRTKGESLAWAAGGVLFAVAMLCLFVGAERAGLGARLLMLCGFLFFLTLTVLYMARPTARLGNPAESNAGRSGKETEASEQ
jgi:hypothetical protein